MFPMLALRCSPTIGVPQGLVLEPLDFSIYTIKSLRTVIHSYSFFYNYCVEDLYFPCLSYVHNLMRDLCMPLGHILTGYIITKSSWAPTPTIQYLPFPSCLVKGHSVNVSKWVKTLDVISLLWTTLWHLPGTSASCHITWRK